MDACQWSLQIQAMALTIAKCLPTDDLTRVSLILTQLGTNLATIAALRSLDEPDPASSGATAATAAIREEEEEVETI